MPPVWTLFGRVLAMIGVAVLLWLSIVVDLAPFTDRARGWPVPDLLYLAVACLTLRRPGLLPAPLVMVAGLLRDLLSGGPVGAGALALLGAQQLLRARAGALRDRSLVVEWLHVGATAAVVALLPVLLLWLALSDGPSVSDMAARWIVTVTAYPVVVALMRIGRDPALRPGAVAGEVV